MDAIEIKGKHYKPTIIDDLPKGSTYCSQCDLYGIDDGDGCSSVECVSLEGDCKIELVYKEVNETD